MTSIIKKLSLFFLFSIFLGACGSSGRDGNAEQGAAKVASYDGLVQIDSGGMDEVWARPGFDPAAYTKILFKGAGVDFRKVSSISSTYELSDEKKAQLNRIISEEFAVQLSAIESYEIVDAAGPDVLELSIAIVDVVSRVPDDAPLGADIYLSEVGTATLYILFKDSATGQTMVRGSDRRAARNYGWNDLQKSNPINNWKAVRRLAKTWSAGLRRGIDAMRSAGAG